MEKADYQIEGMTMAITKMKQMLDFYGNVFKIQFEEKEMYDSKLYIGDWGGLSLLFCPAAIARNTAVQNRHQFDVLVPDLQKTIELITRYGGTLMGEVVEDKNSWSIGVYDPDNNSMLFKQQKT